MVFEISLLRTLRWPPPYPYFEFLDPLNILYRPIRLSITHVRCVIGCANLCRRGRESFLDCHSTLMHREMPLTTLVRALEAWSCRPVQMSRTPRRHPFALSVNWVSTECRVQWKDQGYDGGALPLAIFPRITCMRRTSHVDSILRLRGNYYDGDLIRPPRVENLSLFGNTNPAPNPATQLRSHYRCRLGHGQHKAVKVRLPCLSRRLGSSFSVTSWQREYLRL